MIKKYGGDCMKKLLFVFTGGTIGSTVKEKYIETDSKKPYALIEGYKKLYGELGEYETVSPYTILSENLNGEYLSKLISTIKEKINDFEGVVVTHGTDTLQYTAAALSYAFGNSSVPIVLVSANYPLEDSRSNGYSNLKGAVDFINKVGKGGTWVSYKNDNDFVKIHRGTRLLAHTCFSHNVFSVKNTYFGHFDENFDFVENPIFSEKADELSTVNACLKDRFFQGIRIEAYPSMLYPQIPQTVKYVIMESYHSGTIDTLNDASKEFFCSLSHKGVKVFLTGVESGVQYESTSVYSEFGVIPLPCISPISAYVKLWMLVESGEKDIDKNMFLSLSGDVI